MGKTLNLDISDAAIRRHADDPDIRELNDSRLPYRFRYGKQRTSGSWHVVQSVQGKKVWRKAGSFPALTTKALKTALPGVMARLAQAPLKASAAVGLYQTLGDVLTWYEQRMSLDRNLSTKRKDTVRSAIKCHLRKRLGGVQLFDLSRAHLDSELIWPLQAACSLAHTRLVFGVLKLILKKAQKLRVIEVDPVAGMMFSDFIPTKIGAKDSRLRSALVPSLIDGLIEWRERDPAQVALAVLMLTHGTRLGETRQAKWSHIDTLSWHIPQAHTKTRVAHNLPLTAQVRAFLDQYRKQQQAGGYDGAFLFPGTRSKKPISERQASEMFARQGGGEWTSHDLRKVARSTWLDLGVDYLIGELLLNHKLKDLQAAYIHTHAEAQKRDALERWHAWLDELGFAELHGKTFGRSAENLAALHATPGAA